MNHTLCSFRYLTLVILLAVIGLTGCTDGLTGLDEATDPPASGQQVNAKFRHAHLYQAPLPEGAHGTNRLLSRYGDLSTSNDFILGASATVLDMNKLISRYEETEGVTVKHSYKRSISGFAIRIERKRVKDVLALILADPAIAWVEPDARIKLQRPRRSPFKGGNNQYLPWGVDRTEADLSSTRAGDGTGRVDGVDLYVLDSGITARDINVVEEVNFVPGSSDTGDETGHGTHVAGTAAAQDNEFGVVGMAPGVDVHNFKVLDDNGQTDLSTVIAAVESITARKRANPSRPMVVNISFGADVGTTEYNALDEAIDASIGAGVVYVIAAGNEGIDASTVTPAHVAGALTVGAYDEKNLFAPFSNYGPGVDLLAPGTNILSCSNGTGKKMPPELMSGTSMAASHVAGAAALYLSRYPKATPAQVREALVRVAVPTVRALPEFTTNLSIFVGGF